MHNEELVSRRKKNGFMKIFYFFYENIFYCVILRK